MKQLLLRAVLLLVDIAHDPEINRLGINIKKNGFEVDRNVDNSITNFLGFTNNALPLIKGYHIAENGGQPFGK